MKSSALQCPDSSLIYSGYNSGNLSVRRFNVHDSPCRKNRDRIFVHDPIPILLMFIVYESMYSTVSVMRTLDNDTPPQHAIFPIFFGSKLHARKAHFSDIANMLILRCIPIDNLEMTGVYHEQWEVNATPPRLHPAIFA